MASFTEDVSIEQDHVRIDTVGKYEFKELFGFLNRVKSYAAESKRDRVLIDSRLLEGKMTEVERFHGGQKIAEIFGWKIKVALLMPPDGITKLGELTALNRGARFLVTHDEPEAISWLLK